MVELLGQAALRTLLLAAIVQLGLGMLGIRRPQLRLLAWTMVLAASIAMPVLQQATPLRLSVLPDLPSVSLTEAAGSTAGTSETFIESLDETVATAPLPWLEMLYLLVAGAMLLRLTLGLGLSLRLLRRATPFQLDWAAGTSIRISQDIAAPVTVARIVLLPPDAVNWPAPMRTAVLAHERAHIARGDFAMLLISHINRAVFWFSPLTWWLHRRLATLAELASDDQAMAVTGDRLAYATVLLEMGRRSGPTLRGVAMARPATLKLRIERILAESATAGSVQPMQQALLAVGAIGLAIIAASSRPIQTIASLPALMPSRAPPVAAAPEAPPAIPVAQPIPIPVAPTDPDPGQHTAQRADATATVPPDSA